LLETHKKIFLTFFQKSIDNIMILWYYGIAVKDSRQKTKGGIYMYSKKLKNAFEQLKSGYVLTIREQETPYRYIEAIATENGKYIACRGFGQWANRLTIDGLKLVFDLAGNKRYYYKKYTKEQYFERLEKNGYLFKY
jgi:hypothetical protein